MATSLSLLLALSACTSSPEASPDSPVSDAAVGVMSVGCEATTERGVGVLLKGGLVLTSAHVIAGADSIEVVLNGTSHIARVLAFDPSQDLATLQINTVATGLALGEIDPGTPAWILTFDHLTSKSASEPVGITQHLRATITDIYQQGNVTRKVLELDGIVRAGDSGSALVDAAGNVGGIVFATSHPANTTGFALDIEPLQGIVAASNLPLTSWGVCD